MPRHVTRWLAILLFLTPVARGADRSIHFENDIEPILSRHGCNGSGCHGKAEGQNGFKLSVFGFDPAGDHAALVKEARGRRVNASAPERSLLLLKVSGQVAHGGGIRLRQGGEDFETLRAWIAAGTPFGDANAPRVIALRMEPTERVLAMRNTQALRVVGRYSDGREIDVTRHARFQSNNDGLATVAANGLVTTLDAPGEVAVMASYLGQVAVFRALIPMPGRPAALPTARFNFIDELVDRKLAKLNVPASPVCDDAEFLRRVFLDLSGALPTSAEVRGFLADMAADKRARLVDSLLQRDGFADLWALRWADLLRVDRQVLGHERAYVFYQWIRGSIAGNKPLDVVARELLTAEGPLREVGPANFYSVAGKPGEMASSLSQVLLGVRIACAECHHHPFDRWTQDDYYGMAAFFAPIRSLGPKGAESLIARGPATATNPRSGQSIAARSLGQPASAAGSRDALADWLVARDNPYFARNLANRFWAHLLGRGLVEPVDDVRVTNPPTNPELLDALARHLADSRFDLRQMIRTICASRTYQTSSRPDPGNERDEQNYSRALLKRIDAEVLLDMVCQATGVPEKFRGAPPGTRAVQLWDSKITHYFLKQFGRPQRVSACECERIGEPNVAQVLHFLNSPELHGKLAHEGGTVARLTRTLTDDSALIDELYLTFFSRWPDKDERRLAGEFLARRKDKRREAAEDLAWSLLNSLEFRFNH